jgi:hypothetical protein
MRANMESMTSLMPLPPDVTATPIVVDGVPAEWVETPGADPAKVVLYLHGGAYVIGSVNTHRDLAGRISRASGARVLNVDYRLAPEHPHPAAVEDATAAYRKVLHHAHAEIDALRMQSLLRGKVEEFLLANTLKLPKRPKDGRRKTDRGDTQRILHEYLLNRLGLADQPDRPNPGGPCLRPVITK